MDTLDNLQLNSLGLLLAAQTIILLAVFIKIRILRSIVVVTSLVPIYAAVLLLNTETSIVIQSFITANAFTAVYALFSVFFYKYSYQRMKQQLAGCYKWSVLALAATLAAITTIHLVSESSFDIQLFYSLLVVLGSLTLFSLSLLRTKNWAYKPVISTPKSVPTVALAIPARNETHSLTINLRKAIQSKYEKLEIVVVDDCSYDKTSQIIRSFAHKGVRFVAGKAPEDGWLGKNSAYQALAEHSSGEYILFSGVDIELSKDTISSIVKYSIDHELDMLSVMPRRKSPDLFSAAMQTLRHYWLAIGLPGKTPTISSLWLIKKDVLEEHGNFEPVKGWVVPEQYFAEKTNEKGNYEMLTSSKDIVAISHKNTLSQYETALRNYYPSMHTNWVFSVLSALLTFWFMLFPFIYFLIDFEAKSYSTLWLLSVALLLLSYLMVVVAVNTKSWVILIPLFPVKLAIEIGLLMLSTLLYEINEVKWKERNICKPVINSEGLQSK